MKVLKFGGSSVSTPERIKSVIEISKTYVAREPIALVFSAFGGITDLLIRLSELALAGNKSYLDQLEQIEKRHLEVVRGLIDIQKQSSVIADVKITINELQDILHGLFLVKERTPRSMDYIMSFGERLSAYIIAEAFKSTGINARFLDARLVVRTDTNFGNAKIEN